MKLASIVTFLSAAASSLAVTVSYDTGYDQAGRSLNVVACSDGSNGLETRYGYKVQGDVPSFPRIGGSSTIPGYNSANCGNCYRLTYKGKSIFVTAIDHADSGFNIALKALNTLTNGQAQQLGRINAVSRQVGVSKCGLTPKRDLKAVEFEAEYAEFDA